MPGILFSSVYLKTRKALWSTVLTVDLDKTIISNLDLRFKFLLSGLPVFRTFGFDYSFKIYVGEEICQSVLVNKLRKRNHVNLSPYVKILLI